jgi:2-polyprenyl-3-methyl-5-hydroxy-6-metoxy-1,4-benzoquinol methylase
MKEKETRLAWDLHVTGTDDLFSTKELRLGPWTSYTLINDPKHLTFALSRYKFCAKMLAGKSNVLEAGCGDGFGAPIVAQAVDKLHCIDWDDRNTTGNRRRLSIFKNITFETADLTVDNISGKYDGTFNIDVIEHLEPKHEKTFIENTVQCLSQQGVMIIGTPNETASSHASAHGVHQHINLKTADSLKSLMDNYFHNTFVFSMNDEMVHTGYYPMAHYLFAMGVGKK